MELTTEMKMNCIKGLVVFLVLAASLMRGTGATNLTASAQSQAPANLAAVAEWNEAQIMVKLEQAIQPANRDIALATALIQTIRNRHLVNAKLKLVEILAKLESLKAAPNIRQFDPISLLCNETKKTILSLELDTAGLKETLERADYLLGRIEAKITESKTFGTELELLREDATALTPKMIHVLDSGAKDKIKEAVLVVLRHSKAPDVEGQILSRTNKYEDNEFIYPRLLALLGEIGSLKSADYMFALVDKSPDKERVAIAKACLKKLATRLKDPSLTEKINQAFNAKSTRDK